VNVFLGLGAPWVIAASYESAKYGGEGNLYHDKLKFEGYFVPAGSLGFSVGIFCILAICCVVVLMLRRKYVGGELGGSTFGRTASCILLVSFWFIYIVMSIVQNKFPEMFKNFTLGIDLSTRHRKDKCNA